MSTNEQEILVDATFDEPSEPSGKATPIVKESFLGAWARVVGEDFQKYVLSKGNVD